MAEHYLRRFGEATTLNFGLFEPDGTDLEVGAVHAAGDTVLMQDEGAQGNTTNGFVDEGTGYSIALTAAEMSFARITIFVIDQTSPKVWHDQILIIETYGDPSGQHNNGAFGVSPSTG